MFVQRKLKPIDKIFGGGVLSFFQNHTYVGNQLPEFHAISIHGKKHEYTGPKTHLEKKMLDVEKRIPKPEHKPIDTIDTYAMHHDLDFLNIQKKYNKTNKTAHDKKHHIKLVHEADERFIQGMRTKEARTADPIVSRISEYAIKGKRWAEEKGLLPPEYLSGIGLKPEKPAKKDPAKRLRSLIAKQNKVIKEHNRPIKGGKYKKSKMHHVITKLLQDKVITL